MRDSPTDAPPRAGLPPAAWPGYVAAAGAVGVATLARLALDPLFGDGFPFTTYFLAAALIAGFGRTREAVLTLIGGGLAAVYLFAPPRYSFPVTDPNVLVGLSIYLAVGAVIVVMSHVMRVARRRAERLLAEASARERVVAEQGERLRTTLASIGDAVITTDTAGRVTNLNPVAETLTGWANAAAAGRPLTEVFHIVNEATRQPVENPAARALREGVVVGLANHTVLIARDGTERPIDDSAAPIRCRAGEVVGCVLVFRDITARHEAERSLRESEERAAFVRRASGVGFWYCDLPFDVLQWDELVKAHFHLPPDAPVTIDTFYARLHPDDREPTRRAIERSIRDRTGYDTAYRTVNPDTGAEMVIRAIGRTFYAADGTPTRFDGVTLDITGQKRAEEEVRRQTATLRAISDTTTDLIFLKDRDCRLVFANPATLSALGLTEREAVGVSVERLFPDPAQAEAIRANDRRVMAAGTTEVVEEVYTGPLGTRTFLSTKTPLRDGHGAVVGVIGISQDITDRKRADESLRAKEAELREAQRVARVGSWRWDAATDATTGSDELFRIYGLDPATRVFPDFKAQAGTLYPHDEWERLNAAVREAVSTGVGYELDVRAIRGGEPIWITARGEVVRDEHGAVVGLRGTVQDVTARRKAGEERRRLVSVIENSPDFIGMSDVEGKPVFVNRAGRRLVGLSDDHDAGRTTIPDYFVEDERPVVEGVVLPAVLKDGRWVGELNFRHFQTGAAIPVLYDVFRVDDPATGGPVHFATVTRDLTERKKAEAEREAGQRTLAALVERCPFGIYIVDDEFRIASMNEGSKNGAFANVRPVVGRPFDEAMRVLWPEPVAADIVGHFRRTLDTGEPYLSRDFVNPRADTGQTEGYEWELHRITLPSGRRGVVCYYYDSTRLRRAEQALKDADRKKDEFLATLAHELRNPLAPIRNGLQIMKLATGDAGAVEKSRSMMERQVGQMARLIDDLMDLSRISRGQIALQKTRLRLADALQDAADIARPLIDERGHEFVLGVPPEPIFVDGDRTRLAQVFSNLLNNAAKYTDTGGRVRLSVERQVGGVVIAVEDDGVGIPAHMLDRVFEMFAQVDRSLEKSQGGLGIGLNIVKRLVEMHAGSVVAESQGEGRGSRFVVRLPTVLSVIAGHPGPAANGTAKPAARRRILVVDDNADGASSLAEMLELMGNETRTANDGLEAVAVAGAFRPDVILMDIGMPKLNGYDACRRVREQPWGGTPVIVACTGWGQDDDRKKSQEAGFDLHMVKPVNPAALEKLLDGMQATTA